MSTNNTAAQETQAPSPRQIKCAWGWCERSIEPGKEYVAVEHKQTEFDKRAGRLYYCSRTCYEIDYLNCGVYW